MTGPVFGLTDVVGQADAKLALVLAATDPRIGGVLLRGHKGSAKTTLARSLAALLGDAPFVELPLSATEDRVVGTLDAAAALSGKGMEFRPGLLAQADGGVLYVDEINLLADHLVDSLLDVAVSGENVIERDGVSHRHPARFVLVASMNPEEGELRPQLLDRFGFCVDIIAPVEVETRVEALERRLAFEDYRLSSSPKKDRAAESSEVTIPEQGLGSVRAGSLSRDVMEAASRLALAVEAEGLRADLTLCRAGSALAGLEGRDAVTQEDLRRVAPLVLAHRSRRGPFDPPTMNQDEMERAMDDALDDSPPEQPEPHEPGDAEGSNEESSSEQGSEEDSDLDAPPGSGSPDRPMTVGHQRRIAPLQTAKTESPRGRFVRDVAAQGGATVSVLGTAKALARRRTAEPSATLAAEDLRADVRVAPKRRTVVLCVDLSGSMGVAERAEAATGTALGLLSHAYQQRDRVSVVGFRGAGAEILLRPTSSVEIARSRLGQLETGGETPLADGILRSLDVAAQETSPDSEPLLVLLTDGRATGAPDAFEEAVAAAAKVRSRSVPAVLLDCETGAIRLGLVERLAEAMGATLIAANSLEPAVLTQTVQGLLDRR